MTVIVIKFAIGKKLKLSSMRRNLFIYLIKIELLPSVPNACFIFLINFKSLFKSDKNMSLNKNSLLTNPITNPGVIREINSQNFR